MTLRVRARCGWPARPAGRCRPGSGSGRRSAPRRWPACSTRCSPGRRPPGAAARSRRRAVPCDRRWRWRVAAGRARAVAIGGTEAQVPVPTVGSCGPATRTVDRGDRARRCEASAARNWTCSSSRFSATTSCGVMWVTPGQRQHAVRPARPPAAPRTAAACARPPRCRRPGRGRAAAAGSSFGPRRRSARPRRRRPGRLSGVPEVALGVVGVVERPVGDRRAGDRGVEDVRAGAAPPARPGTRRRTSRGCRPGVRSRSGNCSATACSASTWSSSTGAARSPCTARSNSGPRPGVPRPSTTTTAKPWSANHWLVRWAPRAATHPLGVRPAVGVHQHRQRGAGLVPGRQQHRGAQLPRARREQGDARREAGRLGERGDRPLGRRRGARSSVVPSESEVLPGDDQRAARQPAAVHAGAGGQLGRARRAATTCTARSSTGRCSPLNSTVSPSTSSTARTCSDGGVTGSPVDHEPARALGVGRP